MKDTTLSSLQHELDLANVQMQQMLPPDTIEMLEQSILQLKASEEDPLNIIRMAHVEADYKRRLEPARILNMLSSLYNEV